MPFTYANLSGSIQERRMRHAAIYLLVLTLSSLGATTSSAQIAWESKLRDAHTKAKQQGKLLLLHFYTDNCVYCERLEAGAFRSDSVAKAINQNYIPVKVHGAQNSKLAQMFKVTKYPTDVIVTTDGKALSHSVSPQQPDRYIAMLNDTHLGYTHEKTMLASGQHSAAPAAAPSAAAGMTAPAVTTNPAAAVASSSPNAGFELPANNMLPAGNTVTAATTESLPVQIPGPGASAVAKTAPHQGASRDNQFVLPGAKTTAASQGTNASLAGARTNDMTLSPADAVAASENPTPSADTSSAGTTGPAKTTAAGKADLAIQGYCPVSVVNNSEWVAGKPELGVIHLGKLYLFANKPAMETFLADPIPYTPMLNEIDVVRFFEEKKIVPGKREWGVIDPVHNRMYFFTDKETMVHFEKNFERYIDSSIEVMDHAIQEANPGV
ncbi:DUF255 domain-containing protein [Stieleria sp. TO1_6]|uniref:thioredoxin family protein n=1 Tax=Stieleria tagensis TaxID=2956795 RepID=UPI00209AB895|nr:thioredoxin family protein [Stieleria tagensis]MCO8121314.1 DUF255 domain-containing protein [Stieleria tagensis]